MKNITAKELIDTITETATFEDKNIDLSTVEVELWFVTYLYQDEKDGIYDLTFDIDKVKWDSKRKTVMFDLAETKARRKPWWQRIINRLLLLK